jgi:hypothetical protein
VELGLVTLAHAGVSGGTVPEVEARFSGPTFTTKPFFNSDVINAALDSA